MGWKVPWQSFFKNSKKSQESDLFLLYPLGYEAE